MSPNGLIWRWVLRSTFAAYRELREAYRVSSASICRSGRSPPTAGLAVFQPGNRVPPAHATAAPTKGRLMRCTVFGLTPNRAAILRTPSVRPGLPSAARMRSSSSVGLCFSPRLRRFYVGFHRLRTLGGNSARFDGKQKARQRGRAFWFCEYLSRTDRPHRRHQWSPVTRLRSELVS